MTSAVSRLFAGFLAAASLAIPVSADAADKLTVLLEWFVNPDHASNPTARRTASSRKDTSWPSQASAAGPHIHNRVRAGHAAGTCTEGSSWLTGLMPEARIFTCISVATVPGDRPRMRNPRGASS